MQRGALNALEYVRKAAADRFSGLAVVGLPLAVDDQLFNCAAVLHRGRLLGLVPKSFIPNYKEFYERRWFAAAATARSRQVVVHGEVVPFGTDRLFAAADVEGLTLGVEICEDLWVPCRPARTRPSPAPPCSSTCPPATKSIGKAAYRRQLVVNQSGRCMAAYVYASCGVGESTTDVVFGGHCLIAENGTLLAESRRFQRDDALLAADVDIDRLRADRVRTNSFGDAAALHQPGREYDRIPFPAVGARRNATPLAELLRTIDAHPFVPKERRPAARALRGDFSDAGRRAGQAARTHRQTGRRPSASPAASIRRWPCWWRARRWTPLGVPRDRILRLHACPASAPATARATTPAP